MPVGKEMQLFLEHAVMYEVNVRQYTAKGDFISFEQHLPRLKAMGVDILWLMPIHPIGIKNRKGTLGSYYSVRDFFDVNPEFGNKEDFRRLVKQVHKHGMKIIIDWVANHAAWDNIWTISNPDFFVRTPNHDFYSPYDWSDVIQIDHRHEAAHDAMREAMCYWVSEFDIDGFRADLAHLTPLHFWVKARAQTAALKMDLIWLAETEQPEYSAAFDILYTWKWMHLTEEFFKSNLPVTKLHELLDETKKKSSSDVFQLYFTSNHDENSWNGTEFEKYGAYAKALAVFSFTFPGAVPLIYSGQEIPNYRRLSFFEKDMLDWRAKPALVDFYSTLTAERKRVDYSDKLEWIVFDKKILAYHIGRDIGSRWVFLNLDDEAVAVKQKLPAGVYADVFQRSLITISEEYEILLEPGGFLLLRMQEKKSRN